MLLSLALLSRRGKAGACKRGRSDEGSKNKKKNERMEKCEEGSKTAWPRSTLGPNLSHKQTLPTSLQLLRRPDLLFPRAEDLSRCQDARRHGGHRAGMPRAGRYGVESSESFFDDGLDDDADDDESLVVVFFSPPSPRPRRLFQAQGRGGALLLDQHCRSSSAAATGKDGKLKSRSFFFSSSSQKPSHPSRPPGHLFFFFFKN